MGKINENISDDSVILKNFQTNEENFFNRNLIILLICWLKILFQPNLMMTI